MSKPPRIDSASASPLPRLRTAADLDAVVREFAGRVARLERELAELRQLVGGTEDAIGAPAEIR
jgi:hypothetical protein